MPAPPRTPRALFIASLAIAGAALAPLLARPKRLAGPLSERRAQALRSFMRTAGGPLAAAGAAHRRFAELGAAWRPELAPPPCPPAVAAIRASEAVARILGPIHAADHPDEPWCEFSPEPPRVSIFWRGTRIEGERMVRAFGRRDWKVHAPRAKLTGVSRELDFEAFRAAAEAARLALADAGFPPGAFFEVRALRMSDPDGFSFEGAVATIGLARPKPSWLAPSS